jgi:hypothetical protein
MRRGGDGPWAELGDIVWLIVGFMLLGLLISLTGSRGPPPDNRRS